MSNTTDINMTPAEMKEFLEALAFNEELLAGWENKTAAGRPFGGDAEQVGMLAGLALTAALGVDGFHISMKSETTMFVRDESEEWLVVLHLNALDLFDVMLARMVEIPGYGVVANVASQHFNIDCFQLQPTVFKMVERAVEVTPDD